MANIFLILTNILLIVLIFLKIKEKKLISEKYTNLLIRTQTPVSEIETKNKTKIEIIKSINSKYKVGLINSKKILESIKK